jgi:hypothetical protein
MEPLELLYLCLHQIIESTIESWHTDHHCGLEYLEVVGELQHITRVEADSHLDRHGNDQHEPFIDMGQWQVGYVGVVLVISVVLMQEIHASNVGN